MQIMLAHVLLMFIIAMSAVGATFGSDKDTVHLRGGYHSGRELREATRNTTDNSGGNGRGESEVDWLGRHWYVFVVFLVMVIVVVVLLCGCLLHRERLHSNYPLQLHQNGSNRYAPHINTPFPPSLPDGHSSHPPPPHLTPAHSSIQTTESSSTRHTAETSFTTPSLSSSSPARHGHLPPTTARSNTPPISSSDSPWSFIQIVAKGRGSSRQGEGGREEGRRRGSIGGIRHKTHHHHSGHFAYHHHHHHHHGRSPNYWRRRQRHRPHHSYPLAKRGNGVLDDSGASLCSVPSTCGSVPSDQSSHRSDHSNSCSHSENSTVVEVNVNVRLSPDQLDRSRAVAMAALAESARQLAESAANLGFSNEVQTCTRSLPHSPYPPPRHSHRHPRHSITGAPLTVHSPLPPPSHDHSSHLYHSRSSSHLPPLSPSLRLTTDPRSSSPHSRLVERKSSSHYSPCSLAMVSGGGRITEDEGTVVSLDRHSSSSSCHCSSMVTHEQQGQRSVLTQSPLGKMGDTVVNLDRYSSVCTPETEPDVTVVSLDRTERSTAGDLHQNSRSMNHGHHRISTTDPSLAHCEGGRDLSNVSPDPSTTSGRSHKSLHSRLPPPQPTAHLNLDSQIEDTPLLKQGPRVPPHRDDRHVLNGFSYHPHISLQTYPHLHHPPSPLHQQQLQNISEQGESECVHSSDNYELEDRDLGGNRGKAGEVSGGQGRLAEADLLLGVKKVKREGGDKVSREGMKAVRKRMRRKERHTRDIETGEGKVAPERSDSDNDAGAQQDIQAGDKERETNCEVIDIQQGYSLPVPVDRITQKKQSDSSVSPLEPRSNRSSSPSPSFGSLSPEKAQSLPGSGSVLSVSEPLGSTASGYAATGESGSTCDIETKSATSNNDVQLGPEFEEIQQALLEARSQFSYPLQRLLLEHKSESSGSNGLTLPQLLSPQSHSSSDSEHLHSHSAAQISSFGNVIRSVQQQQIQSVDI